MAEVDNSFINKEEGVGFVALYYSDMPFSLSIFDYNDNFLGHISIIKQPESVADFNIFDQNDMLTEELLKKILKYLSENKNWKRYKDGAIEFLKAVTGL